MMFDKAKKSHPCFVLIFVSVNCSQSAGVLATLVSQKICLFQVTSAALKSTKGKERSALFNGELNTFYLRLYGVGHFLSTSIPFEGTVKTV